mgnify:CR=1 FL=1
MLAERVHFCVQGETRVREGEWVMEACAAGLRGVVMKECVVKGDQAVWRVDDHCGMGVRTV